MVGAVIAGTVAIIIIALILSQSGQSVSIINAIGQQYATAVKTLMGKG